MQTYLTETTYRGSTIGGSVQAQSWQDADKAAWDICPHAVVVGRKTG